MEIKLSKREVLDYSSRYAYDGDDKLGITLLTARKRGYLSIDDLINTARWKYPGGALSNLVFENTPEEMHEISNVSFTAKSERLRIGALLALRGVQWPMASVILHFAFPDKYPILDVRVMRAVGGDTYYTFEKWMAYINVCKIKSHEYNVSLRLLDKALWVYDKERSDKVRN